MNRLSGVLLLMAACALSGCGGSSSQAYAKSSDASFSDTDGPDLTDSDADTTAIKGGETYDRYDDHRDDLGGSAGSYDGYGCTEDCSGHDAGYRWAENHGITDESECGGMSWSFEEGCVAYARAQSEGDEDER